MLIWLVSAIVAGFALQIGFRLWPDGDVRTFGELSLNLDAIRSARLWTLITHSFLHDPYPLHVMVSLLGLYFLGRELLPVVGSRRFVGLYTGAILTGALLWLSVHWQKGGVYYGASAGGASLLVVFACFYPNRRMDFLLLFVFPVSVKPKHIVLGLLAFETFGLFFYELGDRRLPLDYSLGWSAHLGGMLAGWCYYRYFHDVPWHVPALRSEREAAPQKKRLARAERGATPPTVDLSNPSDVRAEVDRILDKINSQGLPALTAGEKRLLDEAKGLLNRR